MDGEVVYSPLNGPLCRDEAWANSAAVQVASIWPATPTAATPRLVLYSLIKLQDVIFKKLKKIFLSMALIGNWVRACL